jgi:hypothetical protein
MKQKVVLLHFVLTFLLSAMIVTTAAAQERTAGVTEGDWFTYEVDACWNSNDPNAIYPPVDYENWEITNQTEWAKMEITSVSGTNVSVQYLTHFENGTEDIGDGYIDVATGDESNAALTIIAANLDANDNLYTSGDYSMWTINDTITRTYQDGVRNTNHINMTFEFSWTENETEYYITQFVNLYWDKETGILVEDSFEYYNQTGEYLTTWSAGSRITDSSVWVIPEFPVGSSMLVIAVIVTVTIISIEHRLTKKQPANNIRCD